MDEEGKPVRHTNFYGRHFRPTVTRLVKAGLFPRGVNFHSLRHSGASILINAGYSLHDVSKRLGHSTITMTSNTYGHLEEARDRAIAEGLDAAFAQAPAPSIVPLRKAAQDD